MFAVGMEYLLNGNPLLHFPNKKLTQMQSNEHDKAFRRKSILENDATFKTTARC